MSAPPRRNRLDLATSVLTSIGLVGSLIAGFGILSALGPIHGCAAGIGLAILMAAAVLFLVVWTIFAGLALWGLVFLWTGSRLAPFFLIPVNLLLMVFFGVWSPVLPGQLVWGIVVTVLALTPAVACALLIHMALSRGSIKKRVAAMLAVVALASWPASLYVVGVFNDMTVAITPSAQPALTAAGAAQPC